MYKFNRGNKESICKVSRKLVYDLIDLQSVSVPFHERAFQLRVFTRALRNIRFRATSRSRDISMMLLLFGNLAALFRR